MYETIFSFHPGNLSRKEADPGRIGRIPNVSPFASDPLGSIVEAILPAEGWVDASSCFGIELFLSKFGDVTVILYRGLMG